MTRTQSVTRTAERRRDAVGHASARCSDLQLDLVDYEGQLLCRVGGRYDRALCDYVGNATTSRIIRMHPGQVEPALWFDRWLAAHLAGETLDGDTITDCLLVGGRRSGKSVFGVAAACCYAVAVPGSIVWLIAPSEGFYEELIGYVESMLPREWYESLGAPHWTYFLSNGSRLVLRSGHTPGKLKKGRADFVLINEGQQFKEQSYTTVSASIVDVGGLVMTAANPPDVGDEGEWVAEATAETERGERPGSKFFFFDPSKNPEISHTHLESLADKMSEHEYDVQIKGLFRLPPDAVLYAWNKTANEARPPDIGDVTGAFTRKFEGREYRDLVSIDVQNFPWIAAIRARAYRHPLDPRIESSILWVIGEAYVDRGDEVDCANQLKAMGCDPESTLVVMDASCMWQQQQRDASKQRSEYRGRGSMDVMRGEGFRYVVPPDPKMKANPDIIDRCRGANARIGTKSGQRYVMADPWRAPLTIDSVRAWRTRSGKPSRHARAAHGGDALTYLIWRFFPRRETSNVESRKMKRRFTGAARLKGFG